MTEESVERRISVVIPSYNGAVTLGDTLESLQRQTSRPSEVLVVDDGSGDDSADIAEQHPLRPRVIRLGVNHGVAFARNVGLREATSELVAFLDQDDLWVRDRLERLSQAFADHPHWRAVVTDEVAFAAEEDRAALTAMRHDFLPLVEHWRPRHEVLSLLDSVDHAMATGASSERIAASRIIAGSITVTTSYVLDRRLAIDCGGFASWLRSADDWILLQTMSRYTDFRRLRGAPVLYRVHPRNTSMTTVWPMPLMAAAAAVRLGGTVVPPGAERDPDVVGRLGESPFLQHVLHQRARSQGWRARGDAVAVWQLLATDGADRRATGRTLLRSLVAGSVPSWVCASVRRARTISKHPTGCQAAGGPGGNLGTVPAYNSDFYHALNDAGSTSADVVLPLVLERVRPSNAVDVGCGTGIWTAALLRHGVDDVVGIDGDYVPRHQLRVASEHFRALDIGREFDLERRFDLAVCVEVAEHLDPTRADGFVADLVKHADAVLFSAATPLQGGTHHVNEQWPDYWIGRFERHGYSCWDVIRPLIRYNPGVAWIYRQNLMLVLASGHRLVAEIPLEKRLQVPHQGDVRFEYVARYLLEREEGLIAVTRRLPKLVWRAVRRRTRWR